MAKEKQNKVVGNSFEDLKLDEMAKTQGAGDTEGETWALTLELWEIGQVSYEISKSVVSWIKG